ncbi:nucleotidyltransferase family protein [Gluconobacter thailandicus]|uniref:Nucleotidyltransferase family protein n=1 Tax=Gluconobacter thailandicus TaxID=257438 RepID=A0AAP9EPP4_GLUTH|nr:nucleotidyltransferase family protein [Gluconobacter thailandicus]QEH95158.1 nucleotidyltransferase family protein [Gluconobacter thailandicus]
MSHNAVLLAAGGSRRLGQPKQLLMRQGIPLVRHVADLLLQTQPDRLIIVTGGNAEAVEAALIGLPVEICRNPDWETGLASSLQSAAKSLKGSPDAVLIAGTDQPRLTLMHLMQLLEHSVERNIVSQYRPNARGIPVRLTAETLARASELQGDKGFRDLWKDNPPLKIQAPELLEDLDTPEQLADAVKAGWIDQPT